jgi:hypothetical protein
MGTWAYNLSYKRGINLGPHISYHMKSYRIIIPSTFNSLSNILFTSPLSPGRASTKSSLSTMRVASKRDRVQVELDTLCTYPLNFEIMPR